MPGKQSITELQLPAPGDYIYLFIHLFIYLFIHSFIHLDAEDWTQGLTCVTQVLYHWAIHLGWRLFLKSINTTWADRSTLSQTCGTTWVQKGINTIIAHTCLVLYTKHYFKHLMIWADTLHNTKRHHSHVCSPGTMMHDGFDHYGGIHVQEQMPSQLCTRDLNVAFQLPWPQINHCITSHLDTESYLTVICQKINQVVNASLQDVLKILYQVNQSD